MMDAKADKNRLTEINIFEHNWSDQLDCNLYMVSFPVRR